MESRDYILQTLDLAISAHLLWKHRLRKTVDNIKLLEDVLPVKLVNIIETDSLCEFGRWLHSEAMGENLRSSSRFLRIVDMHADFHRLAAKVVYLANLEDLPQVNKMLNPEGEFDHASNRLIHELEVWRGELA